MNENYFMGLDGFVWFTGVVENRNDPAKLGRVQVRCLGYHTEDLNDIPSEDLPWAHVMHPVTDPAMQGMGNTPSFLTEGTWVIGFFRDANEKQQPIIMGSLPGIPATAAADNVKATKATNKYTVDGIEVTETTLTEEKAQKGFQDPNGKYPGTISHSGHTIGESDVSRLARGEDAENHTSLKNRRATLVTSVPNAIKPNLEGTSTQLTSDEKRTTFDEPHPRGVETTGTSTGQYPFNHVHESESGHIIEIDDTPGGERLYRQHKSGTFEEILSDGTKTVKVFGDNYELIAGSTNVQIRGNINLSCEGTKREFIRGDYILEVGGNFTRKIGANEQVKIGASGAGNLEEQIRGNHGFKIQNTQIGDIGTDTGDSNINQIINIGGNQAISTGGGMSYSIGDRATIHSYKDLIVYGDTSLRLGSLLGNVSMLSGAAMNVKAGTTLNIKSEAVGTLLFSGDGSTVTANNADGGAIELTGHKHTDTVGLLAGTTTKAIPG